MTAGRSTKKINESLGRDLKLQTDTASKSESDLKQRTDTAESKSKRRGQTEEEPLLHVCDAAFMAKASKFLRKKGGRPSGGGEQRSEKDTTAFSRSIRIASKTMAENGLYDEHEWGMICLIYFKH
eukprot:jgi/Bigna1/138560/aug1.45_g13268